MNIAQLRVLIALNRLIQAHTALQNYVAVIEGRQGAANPLADMDAVLLPSLKPPLNQLTKRLNRYFIKRGMHN
jgi:hypothetical protein